MSSDADDDQVLPDSLQKLEIVPIYSQSQSACKVNNERDQNPFLTALSTTSEVDERVRRIANQPQPERILSCFFFSIDYQRPVWANLQ